MERQMTSTALSDSVDVEPPTDLPVPTANRPAKQWGGRFSSPTDPMVERFTASVAVDSRLVIHDIAGSIAHARMLGRQGIITASEAATIEAGLVAVRSEVAAGT